MKIKLLTILLFCCCAAGYGFTRSDYSFIKGKPLVSAAEFGLATSATGAVNRTALVAALASYPGILIPAGTYTIDNSTGPVSITSSGTTVWGAPGSVLIAATYSQDLLQISADDVSISGLTLYGPGGIDAIASDWATVEDRPALIAAGATGSIVIKNPVIESCRFVDPGVHSIAFFKVVGGRIRDNVCISTATYSVASTTPSLSHIGHVSLQTSAYCEVTGNDLRGLSSGILGGGSSVTTFDSDDGVTTGDLRNFLLDRNTIRGTISSCIYIDGEASNYVISNNVGSATNMGISAAGIGITITGNQFDSLENTIIKVRNPVLVSITGNTGTTYGTGANAMGVWINGSSQFITGPQNVTITGNCFYANAGAGPGIRIDGEPGEDLVDLNNPKNILITGNTLSGFAEMTSGAYYNGMIYIYNMPYSDFTGSPAAHISIVGNTLIARDPNTRQTSGIIIRGGCNGWNISNNSIYGVASSGCGLILQGCSNGSAIGNTIYPAELSAGTSWGGVQEITPAAYQASDSGWIATGTDNLYAANLIASSASWDVIALDASTKLGQDRGAIFILSNASFSVVPFSAYSEFVASSTNDITATPVVSSAYTFQRYATVIISNVSTGKNVTFQPAGLNHAVGPGERHKFMQTAAGFGANTWIIAE